MRNFGIVVHGPLAGEPYASDLKQFELLEPEKGWVTYHLKEKELIVPFRGGRIVLSVQYWQSNDREFSLTDQHRTRVIDWFATTEEERAVCSELKRTPSPLLARALQALDKLPK